MDIKIKKIGSIAKKAILENGKLKKELERYNSKKTEKDDLQRRGMLKGRVNAAQYLNISTSTVDRMIRNNELKAIKKSYKSSLYFELKELDRFLKKDMYGR